jgi:hypothetical protein
MTGHFVYILSATLETRPYSAPICKVGTTGNIRARMGTIKTSCPFDLTLYRLLEVSNRVTARAFERMFHITQEAARMRGDWFDLDPETAWRVFYQHMRYELEEHGGLTGQVLRGTMDDIEVESFQGHGNLRLWGDSTEAEGERFYIVGRELVAA